jgi:hypothetical protein
MSHEFQTICGEGGSMSTGEVTKSKIYKQGRAGSIAKALWSLLNLVVIGIPASLFSIVSFLYESHWELIDYAITIIAIIFTPLFSLVLFGAVDDALRPETMIVDTDGIELRRAGKSNRFHWNQIYGPLMRDAGRNAVHIAFNRLDGGADIVIDPSSFGSSYDELLDFITDRQIASGTAS